MADPVPSVAVAAGSLVVTASAPVLVAAENDLFCARGQAVPIASRQSPTQITLKQPWPVAALNGETAFNILSLGEYWRSAISINKRFADLLAKWEVANPLRFDAAGTLAGRDNYNNQPKSFVYIAIDPLPVRLFIKLTNTNSASDWSLAIYIGNGGQVEFQEALAQERTRATAAEAALGLRVDDVTNTIASVNTKALKARSVADTAAASGNQALIATDTRFRPLTGNVRTVINDYVFPPDNIQGIAIGIVPPHDIPEGKWALRFDTAPAGIGFFRLQIIQQTAVILENEATRNFGTGRVTIYDTLSTGVHFPAIAVCDDPSRTDAREVLLRSIRLPVEISLPALPALAEDGTQLAYFLAITPLNGSGGVRNMAFGRATVRAGATPSQRGFICVNNTWLPYSNGNDAISFTFFEPVATPTSQRDAPRILAITEETPAPGKYPNLSVPFPKLTIERSGQPIVIPAQVIVFDPPDINRQTTGEPTFMGGNPYPVLNVNINASTFSLVKDNGNGSTTPLTAGTHYTLDPPNGTIQVIPGNGVVAAGNAVLATYQAPAQRYDLVAVDNESGVLVVTKGIERGCDVCEFRPAVPQGQTGLYYVHIAKLGTGPYDVEIVPIGLYRDQVRVARRAEEMDWIAEGRRHLGPLFARMASGQPLTVLLEGDSIMATTGDSFGNSGWYNTADPQRDRWEFFRAGRIGSDVLSALPKYDHGDGAGRVHTHLGGGWAIVEAIEDISTSFCTVVNLAVGGSTSANSEQSSGGRPNLLWDARTSAVVSVAPHLAILHIGTNEAGQTFTRYNVQTWCALMKRAGACVIVLGIPMQRAVGARINLDQWAYTNDALREAARAAGAAFVPFDLLVNPDLRYGGFGIARRSMSIVNSINHPGPSELTAYGTWAAKLIRGG